MLCTKCEQDKNLEEFYATARKLHSARAGRGPWIVVSVVQLSDNRRGRE